VSQPQPESEVQEHLPPVMREIIQHKRREVEARRGAASIEVVREAALASQQPRNFFDAVTHREFVADIAVIAEIKRMSPSAGLIRPEYAGDDFSPEAIAQKYQRAGARAISCLTDERFFGGHLSFLKRVKQAVGLPVLRKDFLIDPWQLYESRAAGADAVLLIAECLGEGELIDMMILAHELRLTVLLEVHSAENLKRVRRHIGFPHPSYTLLGINNRDLSSMHVDLEHTARLLDLVPDRTILVSESGIRTRGDLDRLHGLGVKIVLVGEHLMRQPDPGVALDTLMHGART
jgi:indole-3-glycerol phosphate synthase